MKTFAAVVITALATLFLPLACRIALAEAPISMTVTTNSVKILPMRGMTHATLWTNGIAVAQGNLVENGRRIYMAETNVVAAAVEPTHYSGVANGLRYIPMSFRSLATIQNLSGDPLFLSFDAPAEVNKGLSLSEGGYVTITDVQAAIYGISTGSVSVVATELPK